MTKPCEACGVELHFQRNQATGKSLPLQKVKNVYVVEDGGARALSSTPGPMEMPTQYYVSHFETCPKASGFTRRRRG